ncbi:MAG TPA: hypothetical protein VF062_28555 [Candidatus Limnocylindrales bacterium]
MKRSITAALVVATAAFALSACGVGRNAQTAEQVAPVPGIYADFPAPGGNGSVGMRNVALAYPGPEGYKAGSEATARFWFFNNTQNAQTVVVRYNGQTIHRGDVAPLGYDKPEARFQVTTDVKNYQMVPMEFEFVGLVKKTLEVPVITPDTAGPAEKVEFTEGEGH